MKSVDMKVTMAVFVWMMAGEAVWSGSSGEALLVPERVAAPLYSPPAGPPKLEHIAIATHGGLLDGPRLEAMRSRDYLGCGRGNCDEKQNLYLNTPDGYGGGG
jgi:hypothetical protein